ncbi:MAG: cell division protein FtsI [Peptococcaceae bacterium]|nr:cell division protein FtsI [Peptococcaceae bacterium]
MKNNILKLGILMLGLFAILVVYLSYLQVIRGPSIAASPYNHRFQEYEAQVQRGTIYDARGTVLARTEFTDGKGKRVYPEGRNTAHLLGYISEMYGRAGLESAYDRYLLGREGADRIRNYVNKILDRQQSGGDMVLTLDAGLQELAVDLLGGRRGAVVLLDPRSGAVRAMATSPSFDPNKLDTIWNSLVADEDSPLLNRATQGAYPPGSTFKVVTAAGALAEKPDLAAKTFNCPGFIEVNGYKLMDTDAHGDVDLKKALAVSCNTTFAQLGVGLGPEGFERACKAFGLTQDPGLGLPARAGTMASVDKLHPAELASSAIGQGEVLVSPLQMALVAAAIANKGVIMRPYLVDNVKDSMGEVILQTAGRKWLTATTPQIAATIKEGMLEAVRYGTATAAAVSGTQVAGKTGSAQNPHGATHAWFIGFAPASQPTLAVAVIVENSGSGGAVAAPIASRLIAAATAKGY